MEPIKSKFQQRLDAAMERSEQLKSQDKNYVAKMAIRKFVNICGICVVVSALGIILYFAYKVHRDYQVQVIKDAIIESRK